MAQYTLRKDSYQYDVFLSHASEDKDDVARPLAVLLQERGLRVWYDELEFRIGDNIVEKLSKGIDASRFGIVVFSKAFIDQAKNWTRHELDTLEYLWITENRIIFPVWHKITLQEIREFRVSLANIYGRSTATHTIEEIANEIQDVIAEFDLKEISNGEE